mgnify:CR=1 FL=1
MGFDFLMHEKTIVKFLKNGEFLDLKLGLSKEAIIKIFSLPDLTNVFKSGQEIWLYQDLQLTFQEGTLFAYKFEPFPKHPYLNFFTSDFFQQHLMEKKDVILLLDKKSIRWDECAFFTYDERFTILTEGNVLLYYTDDVLGRIAVTKDYTLKETN